MFLFQDYQEIVDAEWQILYDKMNLIKDSGAEVCLQLCRPLIDVWN